MKRTFLFAILLFSFVVSARAETVAAIVREWGLVGTWQLDCDAAPGKARAAQLRYEVKSDGRVFHYRDFGKDTDSENVKAARITPEGWIELKIYFPRLEKKNRDRTFAIKRIDHRSIQAVYNYDTSGEYTIKNGKSVTSGNDALVQYRCN
jgi:hypothetical protein